MTEGRKAIVDQIEEGLQFMRDASEEVPGAWARLDQWARQNDTRRQGEEPAFVLGQLLGQLNPCDVLTIRP